MIRGAVARHTILVIRAPLVADGRGNLTRDWDGATETESPGWAIDAGPTSEDSINREGSSVEYTIRGPYAADVLATDRVRLQGGLFQVDGAVARQPGVSPRTSHTIVRLTSWEG